MIDQFVMNVQLEIITLKLIDDRTVCYVWSGIITIKGEIEYSKLGPLWSSGSSLDSELSVERLILLWAGLGSITIEITYFNYLHSNCN